MPINKIKPDNEYLIKVFYNFIPCTEILEIIGEFYDNRKLQGNKYLLYDENKDYYICVLNKAEKPIIVNVNTDFDYKLGTFKVITVFPQNDGETEISLDISSDNVLVMLNGLTLARNYDYVLENNICYFNSPLKTSDVITVAEIINKNVSNYLKIDTIIVENIDNGPTTNEITNNVYFNTEKNKFEIYTNYPIDDNSDIIVVLNGLTLSNNIDYYL